MAANIIISTILVLVVISIIISLFRRKKAGATACGNGCANCPSTTMCHKP